MTGITPFTLPKMFWVGSACFYNHPERCTGYILSFACPLTPPPPPLPLHPTTHFLYTMNKHNTVALSALKSPVSVASLVPRPSTAPAETMSSHVLHKSSLVPRPFPPPVFDRILYAKMEGEGLGERVTCVTSGRREGIR